MDSSDSCFITANVTNSHNDAVAFEMKFAKDITIAQLKVLYKRIVCKQLKMTNTNRC